jgi:NADPH-dependent 2,4-dienoyl-CoA reductase/sulfur reductase-like enzyme
MKEMLADAKKNHYAIPAFDVSNYEMMKAVLETCEEEKSPALLMTLGVDTQGRNLQLISSMINGASNYFKIPICLHMDHATDIDFIKYGCDNGYSSVMYDGSVLSFDENAKNTAIVTEYAHKKGITVEAELGHVGNASVGSISETGTDTDPGESLTVPEEVAKFVEITDVDALDADEVIVATGAKANRIPVPGAGRAIQAVDFLLGERTVGENVVIIGGGLTGCEIAYELYLQGKKPVIVEMLDDLVCTPGICLANTSYLRDFFKTNNVPVYLETGVTQIDDLHITIRDKDGNTQELKADDVILSVGYKPAPVAQKSKHVHIIGDAHKVGNLRSVIWGAWDTCMKL